MKHVLLAGLLLLFSSCTPNAAIEAGTDCDEHCPVGAERISAKEASGSCGLDGSYNPFTDAVSIGGTCVGTGKCQVVCLYPECGEGKTLVITAEEFRCEPADPCQDVDCSGHGRCRNNNDQAQCVCDIGYQADGLACVACVGMACALSSNPPPETPLLFGPQTSRQVFTLHNEAGGPVEYHVALGFDWAQATAESPLDGTLQAGEKASITLELVPGLTLQSDLDFAQGEVVITSPQAKEANLRLTARYSTGEECRADCGNDPTSACPQCPDVPGAPSLPHCDGNGFCRVPPVVASVAGVDPQTNEEQDFAEIACPGTSGWELVLRGLYFSRPLSGQEVGNGNELRIGGLLATNLQVSSAREGRARLPGGLDLPDDGSFNEFSVVMTAWGVPSEPVPLRVRRSLPEIERVQPDVASRGETVRLHGRHFTVCNTTDARVRFTGCEATDGITPQSLSDSEIEVEVPSCAVSGLVTVLADGRQSRAPHPTFIVRDSEEARVDLLRTPPLAVAVSPRRDFLALVTQANGFKLRLFSLTPGDVHEMRCGNASGESCLSFSDTALVAGTRPLIGGVEIYVHVGQPGYLKRFTLLSDRDYETQPPTAPEDIGCSGDAACATAPSSILPDPSGKRLLLLAAGRVYELDTADGTIRPLSPSDKRFRSLVPDPYGRYAFGIAVPEAGGNPTLAVLDIFPPSESGTPLSQERGHIVWEQSLGISDARLALSSNGRYLAVADPSGAVPFSIRLWDVSDPRRPAAMAPRTTPNGNAIEALSALTFSADNATLYGATPSGEVVRFLFSDQAEVVPEMLSVMEGTPVKLRVEPDGSRLVALTTTALHLLSLEQPTALVESVSPEFLIQGEQVTVQLAAKLGSEATVQLLLPETVPVPLASQDPFTYGGLLSVQPVSGLATLRCTGRPDSPAFSLLGGKAIVYARFEEGEAVDEVLTWDEGDNHWVVLVNHSPGKVGLIKTDGNWNQLEDRGLLEFTDAYGIVGTALTQDSLVGVRRDRGFFHARLATWPAVQEPGPDLQHLPNPGGITYDPTTELVFISDKGMNHLARRNQSFNEEGVFVLGDCIGPQGLLVQGDTLYVACTGSSSLLSLSAQDGTLHHSAMLGFPVEHLSPGPGSNYLLAAGGDRAALVQINADLGSFGESVQEFVVGPSPRAAFGHERILIGANEHLHVFDRSGQSSYLLTGYVAGATTAILPLEAGMLIGQPNGTLWFLNYGGDEE